MQEARCILKCRRAGVLTPAIFLVDEDKGRLYLEKVQGGSLKTYLQRGYKLGTLKRSTDLLFLGKFIDVLMSFLTYLQTQSMVP